MGEACRRRAAYQKEHGGPMPPPMEMVKMRTLPITVPLKFAELLEARWEAMGDVANKPLLYEWVANLIVTGLADHDSRIEQAKQKGSLIALPSPAQVQKVVG